MAPKRIKGAKSVESWRKSQGVTALALAEAVGDSGGQVVKWLNGSRARLPLKLKVALARHTGLALAEICDRNELQLAEEMFALVTRDASTPSESAA